jgi:hypothetical protein
LLANSGDTKIHLRRRDHHVAIDDTRDRHRQQRVTWTSGWQRSDLRERAQRRIVLDSDA